MSGTMITVFVDVRYNDDSICRSISLIFLFLVDNLASGKGNSINNQITSKRQRCPDLAFIYRNKEYRLTAG